jgi:selenocysteine-specific elongation factor
MRVIGTAGHVDHGKSTLVAALTGIHPDRLKEEKEREMTIDLGFAWMDLPSGETVGIVDVPGHRDFIENMLAGVGGIDAVLFVIAADEGIMPQTREHLAILDLLEIPSGVIVLTKIDMIEDPEWLDLVEGEVAQTFSGTVLAEAPILRVSARKGIGLDELRQALDICLETQPVRPDLGRARLPIDRVFSITGFGTVVTGTLLDGILKTGEEVEILPEGIKSRIRGLQTHKKKEDEAFPGSRVAANITSVETSAIRRGDTLARPGKYKPTRRLDVSIRLLKDTSTSLQHDDEVKFFTGTNEQLARVRVLGADRILPGENGYLQVETSTSLIAERGDHFILRRPSPGETLGGGRVIDPHPRGRYKRFSAEDLSRLELLQKGSPRENLLQTLNLMGAVYLIDLAKKAGIPFPKTLELLNNGDSDQDFLILKGDPNSLRGDSIVIGFSAWSALSEKAANVLAEYHRSYPLRLGIPKEEFRAKLKLSNTEGQLFFPRWKADGLIKDHGTSISLATHQIALDPVQKKSATHLLKKFADSQFSPPSVKECQQEVGEEVYAVLVSQGDLVQLNPEVVVGSGVYKQWKADTLDFLKKKGKVTVAEFRDRNTTSRKFALAFLEDLDAKGITRREGDYRVLGRGD